MGSAQDPPEDETTALANAERSRKRTRRALAFLPGVLLVGLLVWGLLASASDHPADSRALSFDLPRLTGSGSVSSSELAGRPVVLNFWASWCTPCKEEMPDIDKVWRRYRGRVTIVGVNVEDSPEAAREFAAQIGVSYPLVTDPTGRLTDELHVAGLPQTFFLDSDLHLVGGEAGDRQLGTISAGALQAKIEELLGD